MTLLTMAEIGKTNADRKITGRDDVRRSLAEPGFAVGEEVRVVSEMNGGLIPRVRDCRMAPYKAMAVAWRSKRAGPPRLELHEAGRHRDRAGEPPYLVRLRLRPGTRAGRRRRHGSRCNRRGRAGVQRGGGHGRKHAGKGRGAAAPVFAPLGSGNRQSTVATVMDLVVKEAVVGVFGVLCGVVDENGGGAAPPGEGNATQIEAGLSPVAADFAAGGGG